MSSGFYDFVRSVSWRTLRDLWFRVVGSRVKIQILGVRIVG